MKGPVALSTVLVETLPITQVATAAAEGEVAVVVVVIKAAAVQMEAVTDGEVGSTEIRTDERNSNTTQHIQPVFSSKQRHSNTRNQFKHSEIF